MAKSRIKTEEEYNQILGVNLPKEEKEDKTTHDASQYFDELRGVQSEPEKDLTNPFDHVISVEQIKETLKHSSDNSNDIEKIKEQIASAQRDIASASEVEDIEETIIRPAKHSPENKREFSFEENARKLYENLRGSSLNKQTPRTFVEEEPRKENKLEVIEPISISKERVNTIESTPEVVSENTIPETSSLEDNFTRMQNANVDDKLELTADFTLENENFIDAINQQKNANQAEKEIQQPQDTQQFQSFQSIQPVQPVEQPNIQQDISEIPSVYADEPSPKELKDELDIAKQLEEQMVIIDAQEEQDINEIPISEEPAIDSFGIENELNLMTKQKPKENLNNTLTLALNQDESVSFSTQDMRTLKDDDLGGDTKTTKKAKISDVIITISLIIMICVVIFLLVNTFILNK